MAGNLQPQMAGMTANMMAQMQQLQDHPFTAAIYQSLQNNTPSLTSGWQASVLIAERFGYIQQMYVRTAASIQKSR